MLFHKKKSNLTFPFIGTVMLDRSQEKVSAEHKQENVWRWGPIIHHMLNTQWMRSSPTSNFFAGTSNVGHMEAEPNTMWPHKTNQLFDKVELRSVYYTRTYLIVSNQLQIQQRTLFLFASGFLKSLTLFRPRERVFSDPPKVFVHYV